MAKFVSRFRIGYELYSRITDQSHIEACQVGSNPLPNYLSLINVLICYSFGFTRRSEILWRKTRKLPKMNLQSILRHKLKSSKAKFKRNFWCDSCISLTFSILPSPNLCTCITGTCATLRSMYSYTTTWNVSQVKAMLTCNCSHIEWYSHSVNSEPCGV